MFCNRIFVCMFDATVKQSTERKLCEGVHNAERSFYIMQLNLKVSTQRKT